MDRRSEQSTLEQSSVVGPPERAKAKALPGKPVVKDLSQKLSDRGKWLSLILLQLSVVFVFGVPFLWLFLGGLRPESDLLGNVYPFRWNTVIPSVWTIDNVLSILRMGFGRHMFNSFLVASLTVPFALLFDSMAAFSLAWLRVPGRKLLLGLLLLIMIVPQQSTIIPLYLVVSQLGLVDSYAALILPFLARPIGIFVLYQFLRDIPRELADAAIIDGATPFQIYSKVMLPNIVPALITIGLVDFLFAWNQFFWPLIAIQSRSKQMAQVAIGTFLTPDQTFWSELFAASALASLPVIILFLLLQRYYIRGVARTGLHG
jgi:multiple sugar transport system permease protein